jgi:Secretion system C-terminal sorting domain
MKKALLFVTCLAFCFLTQAQTIDPITTFAIELRYFNATKASNNTVVLRWLAPCQTSGATFEIQHSGNARNFSTVHTVTATQERCLEPFDYSDLRLLTGTNFYRIRLITPANYSISSYIIPVVGKGATFEINSLWPNVITSTAMLNFSSGTDDRVHFVITDMNGKRMKTFTEQAKTGNNQLQINLTTFNAGFYTIQAINSKKEKSVLRFQKL